MRGIDVAKQETSTRPRVRSRTCSNAGQDGLLAAGEAGQLDVGAVREERENAAVAPLRERVDVGALVGRRRGVDLEVAAREHHPGRRLDREGEAVEDAVRHPDGVHAEGADLHGLAGHERPQLRLDTALLEPLAGEAEGEAAPVDGRRRGRERVGQRADVVLVAVREEDPAEPLRALGEVLEVGHDRVDPGHLGGREEHTGVEQQEVLLPLQHEGVEAELAEPAERDEADRRRVVGARSNQALAPGGSLLEASQIAANSTTDSVSVRLDPSTLRNLKYSLRLG